MPFTYNKADNTLDEIATLPRPLRADYSHAATWFLDKCRYDEHRDSLRKITRGTNEWPETVSDNGYEIKDCDCGIPYRCNNRKVGEPGCQLAFPVQATGDKGEETDLNCMYCNVQFKGSKPKMCCSGVDCGCMGMPIDPVVCSKGCYDMLTNNALTALQQENARLAGEVERLKGLVKNIQEHADVWSDEPVRALRLINKELSNNI